MPSQSPRLMVSCRSIQWVTILVCFGVRPWVISARFSGLSLKRLTSVIVAPYEKNGYAYPGWPSGDLGRDFGGDPTQTIEIVLEVLQRRQRHHDFGDAEALEPVALIDDFLCVPQPLSARIAGHCMGIADVQHRHGKHHFQGTAVII